MTILQNWLGTFFMGSKKANLIEEISAWRSCGPLVGRLGSQPRGHRYDSWHMAYVNLLL